MGCKRLDTDFFDFLELVHSGKSDYGEKKRINYYPFGLEHKGYNNVVSSNSNSVAQNFGYNGKENNPELGIEWMDFGWRNYDAALGKWMNIDPLAENYYDQSAYNYTLNNPVFFVDPDGQRVDVSNLANSESDEDAWLLFNLAVDLADISGQKISFDREGDSTFLSGSGPCGSECNEASSSEANSFISHLLDPEGETITVSSSTNGSNGGLDAPNHINLDATQINSFQEAYEGKGLNRRAFSVGFSFLHESLHTDYGASFYKDSEYGSLQFKGSFNDGSVKLPNGKYGSPVTFIIDRFRKQSGLSTVRGNYGAGTPATIWYQKDGQEPAVIHNVQEEKPKLTPTQNIQLKKLLND